MRVRFFALIGFVATTGCHGPNPAAPAAHAATAPPKKESPARPSTGPGVASGAAPAGSPAAEAEAKPAGDEAPAANPNESPWGAEVEVEIVRAGGERVRIAAESGDGSSTVWAQQVTKTGAPAGPAKKLRVTSGDVVNIAADVSGELIWVAWRSDLEQAENQITALAAFDASLAPVHKPRILRTIGQPPVVDENLIVRGRGAGRVAVAAFIGVRPCKAMHPDEKGSCRAMQVDLVAADGTSERSVQRWLDGGDGAIDGLVATDSGVAATFHVWHGGPLMDAAFVPDNPKKPVRTLPTCEYPPMRPFVVDGSVLLLCPDPAGSNRSSTSVDVGCKATEPDQQCGSVARVSSIGARMEPSTKRTPSVPLRGVTKQCGAERAAVRLEWDGGELDVPAGVLGASCDEK